MQNYIYHDHNRRGKKNRRLSKVVVLVLSVALFVELGIMTRELLSRRERPPLAPVVEVLTLVEPTVAPARPASAEPELAKKDLADLIGQRDLKPVQEPIMSVIDEKGQILYVRTTILPELQAQADAWVKNSLAHQAALVILNPDTGEVLTLAGYDENGGDRHAALASSFPAASLFKIVTAAAAVEKAEFSADSKLAYDGGRHTLYKNNVAKEPQEGRQSTTLEESFAYSINSVFGKLGASALGPEELSDFAGRFGFNSEIEFEMPVESSTFSVEDTDRFHLAELASGYNRSTKVSPLHGAMMAASVVAGGLVHPPTMVREVFDRENRILYQAGRQDEPREVISPATAEELVRLMRSAVSDGTGRKTFGTAANHPVLSKLDIGGKSGTINNDLDQRVDWFVAWAQPRPGSDCRDKLALSAVVVHSGLTNTTSQRLIRDALNVYYKERLKSRPASSPALAEPVGQKKTAARVN